MDKLEKALDAYFDDMVKVRRYLHMHPELSFREYNTAKYIADFYKNLGVDVRTNVGGNGVVAKIKGGKPGKTVALRADFDALPIQDEKDVPYKSTVPGVMHACGHDGHTSVLLHVAKVLFEHKEELAGEYIMIHQHAEEYAPGGAKSMIEDGCLENVDVIFGTHLWATEPTGRILYRSGPIMAAADRFQISILGKGGHGAHPNMTKDSIVTAAQLVVQLQQIVSRKVDPLESAVVSVGRFNAGNAFNVISDRAELEGTVRTFSEEVRSQIEAEIEQVTKGVVLTNGSSYEYEFSRGYPAVVNHEAETEYLAAIAKDVPGVKEVVETAPSMGGEDFAYYLQHVKGTFFFTGAKPVNEEDAFPHHHPKFDIDERAMLIAAKTLLRASVLYQKTGEQLSEKKISV
ncbi:M20 family metallopeptidase [Fervidibacillus albus]|uniref:M20 family metallopeptidase n=1 Tax=Fervidibacillus albus TaxID=2980026 RepID=A0A9E8LSE2_9BACI|nr:M20 family metallopeptidase [Fervidibacillus albus]WAA08708.1 M20 family metallopeptidase [Fervidibacillus albus]